MGWDRIGWARMWWEGWEWKIPPDPSFLFLETNLVVHLQQSYVSLQLVVDHTGANVGNLKLVTLDASHGSVCGPKLVVPLAAGELPHARWERERIVFADQHGWPLQAVDHNQRSRAL